MPPSCCSQTTPCCEVQADSPVAEIRQTTSQLSPANRWDHITLRWGYKRNDHRVAPGLYALG